MSLVNDRPIVLISPVYRESWEYIEDNPAAIVPLGVLSISTVLSEKGYNVKIIDAYTNPNYISEIKDAIEDSPLFIGISAMTAQVHSALKIARLIRQSDPGRRIPLIWGGHTSNYLP